MSATGLFVILVKRSPAQSGSETMAFADDFDMSYVIKRDLRLIGRNIPLTMVTDSFPSSM